MVCRLHERCAVWCMAAGYVRDTGLEIINTDGMFGGWKGP